MKGLYGRQSIDKKESLSIEGQLEQCRTKLQKDEPYEEYQDKGFSGKNTDRPALNKLLNDIKNGLIDCVVVYRLDRFSRNITDFYNMWEVMKQHGCEFVSVSESFDTSTPMGRAMMGILVTFAQMERENIQQRVKDNYYYRIKENGTWAGGTAPYGFNIGRTEDNKPTLVQNVKQMEAVKLMFSLYSSEINMSLSKISRTLTEKGYERKNKNNDTGKGGGWNTGGISKILQNTVYVKADSILYHYLKTYNIQFLNDEDAWDGSHSCHIVGKNHNGNIRMFDDLKEQSVYITNFEGVIDSRTYISVMQRLKKNDKFRNAAKESRLQELTGKLKCGNCGYAVKSFSLAPDGRPYLHCNGRMILHTCDCKYSEFNFYEIQNYVGEQIQEKLDNLKTIINKQKQRKNSKISKIKELENKLDNLVTIAASSDLLEQATMRQIEATQSQINKLQLELKMNADIGDDLQLPSLGGAVLQRYSEQTMEGKKHIVNVLIDRILLHSETKEIEIIWNEL